MYSMCWIWQVSCASGARPDAGDHGRRALLYAEPLAEEFIDCFPWAKEEDVTVEIIELLLAGPTRGGTSRFLRHGGSFGSKGVYVPAWHDVSTPPLPAALSLRLSARSGAPR